MLEDVIPFKMWAGETPEWGVRGRSSKVPVPVMVQQEVIARFADLNVHVSHVRGWDAWKPNPARNCFNPFFFGLSEKPFLSSMLVRSWPCFPASPGTILLRRPSAKSGCCFLGFCFPAGALQHGVKRGQNRCSRREGVEWHKILAS